MIHTFKDNSSSEISFSKYDFVLTSGMDTKEQNKPEEIYTPVLWQGRKEKISWNIELNRRLALPFACLIFGILAPALSNRIGKIGRLGGFSFSLAILILYYSLLITGEALAKTEKVSAFLGAWMPNMVFGAIALIFFYKAYNDKPLRKF
jgi:lipopolysaccharide export LptBFGC system permease protein LptF